MKKNTKYAFKQDDRYKFEEGTAREMSTNSIPKVSMEEVSEKISQLVDQVKDKQSKVMADDMAEVTELISRPEGEVIEELAKYLPSSKMASLSKKDLYKRGTKEREQEIDWLDIGPTALHRFFISDESLTKKACLWSVLKSSNLTTLIGPLLMVESMESLNNKGLFSEEGVKSLMSTGFHGLMFAHDVATLAGTTIPVIGGAVSLILGELTDRVLNLPTYAYWGTSFIGVNVWDGQEDFRECIEGDAKKSLIQRKIESAIRALLVELVQAAVSGVRAAAGTFFPGGSVFVEIAAQGVEGVPNYLILSCLWKKWVSKYEEEVKAEKRKKIEERMPNPDFIREKEKSLLPPRVHVNEPNDKSNKFSIYYIKDIIKVANTLDDKGLFKEADVLDMLIYKLL